MSENSIYFSKNLAFLRKEAKMTQADLAFKLGVKSNTISNYEKGISTPDYDAIKKLTALFRIPADVLLYNELDKTVLSALHEVDKQLKKMAAEEGHAPWTEKLKALAAKNPAVAGAALGAGVAPLGMYGFGLAGASALLYRAMRKNAEISINESDELQSGISAERARIVDAGVKEADASNARIIASQNEIDRLKAELKRKDELIMELSRKIGRLEYEVELLKKK